MWYKSIKELHIEPTSVCNAECPMCARNIYGKELNPYITLKTRNTGGCLNIKL